LSIPPLATASFDVTFRPDVALDFWAELQLESCPDCTLAAIRVQGRGVEPRLRISPAAIDLGLVPLGQTRSAEVTLRNTGGLPVPVEGYEIVPEAGSPFSLSGPSAPMFAGNDPITLTVSFAPQ